jgi:hypothetical protein
MKAARMLLVSDHSLVKILDLADDAIISNRVSAAGIEQGRQAPERHGSRAGNQRGGSR